MLLHILNFFNLHYYDAFLNLESEIKRLKHLNKCLKRKRNLYRDIAEGKKKEEILKTYADLQTIKKIADKFVLFEKVFI